MLDYISKFLIVWAGLHMVSMPIISLTNTNIGPIGVASMFIAIFGGFVGLVIEFVLREERS